MAQAERPEDASKNGIEAEESKTLEQLEQERAARQREELARVSIRHICILYRTFSENIARKQKNFRRLPSLRASNYPF